MRRFRVIVNGSEFEVAIEELADAASTAVSVPAVTRSEPVAAAVPAAKPAARSLSAGSAGNVIAQMPGTIVDVAVGPGDRVTRGQTLLILEAMKMANEVVSPQDGIVQEIRVAKGASVNAGDVLVVLA